MRFCNRLVAPTGSHGATGAARAWCDHIVTIAPVMSHATAFCMVTHCPVHASTTAQQRATPYIVSATFKAAILLCKNIREISRHISACSGVRLYITVNRRSFGHCARPWHGCQKQSSCDSMTVLLLVAAIASAPVGNSVVSLERFVIPRASANKLLQRCEHLRWAPAALARCEILR